MMKILIVDPDSASERLGEVLVGQGYRCIVAQDARTATSILQSGMPVDLVISETRLPDMDGMDFLACLRRTNPALPVIVVTAQCSVEKYQQAANLGVAEYLTKPLYLKEFCRIVRIALSPPEESFGASRDLDGKDGQTFPATPRESARVLSD
jgi:DNA-binding NtrC family response regulator